MINELKKLFLAGVGTASVTYEKASKLIDEMVEKGKLTIEEGKELSEELKKTIKSKKEEYIPIAKDDLTDVFKKINFVTKDDICEIKERLTKLEDAVYQKEDDK